MILFRNVFVCFVFLMASTPVIAAENVPDSGQLLRDSGSIPEIEKDKESPEIVVQDEGVKTTGVSDELRVKVVGFSFRGNTVFTGDELNAFVAEYVDKESTFAELSKAVGLITEYYRKNDYFLAQAIIPQQRLKLGEPIQIYIAEGYLEGIKVAPQGEMRTRKSVFRRYFTAIPKGEPVQIKPLERLSLLLNELPGVAVKVALEPGEKVGFTVGRVKVTEGDLFNYTVDTDNHGSYATGYYQVGAGLRANSPFKIGDSFYLRTRSTTTGDSFNVAMGYSLPFYTPGTRLGINYKYVQYELGEEFEFLDADGNAHNITLYARQPLIRKQRLTLTANMSIGARYLEDEVGDSLSNNKRNIIAGQASISSTISDSYFSGGRGQYSLSVAAGNLSFDDDTAEAIDQGVNGRETKGGFAKINLSMGRVQRLPGSFTLYTAFTGQWASQNLDSSEKMSLGGPNGIRAYPVGEASGDGACLVTLEGRYLFQKVRNIPGKVVSSLFVDYGNAWIDADPAAGSDDNERELSGVGLGANWFVSKSFVVKLSAAWRLTEKPLADTSSHGKRQPVIFAQIIKQF